MTGPVAEEDVVPAREAPWDREKIDVREEPNESLDAEVEPILWSMDSGRMGVRGVKLQCGAPAAACGVSTRA